MKEVEPLHQNPSFYYGWIIVVVVAIGGLVQTAEAYPVLGVLLKPITEEFGWSRSTFAGALTIGTLCGGVVAIFVGPRLDRYGGRWILTVAFIIIGLALILMSRVTTLWQFYVLQAIARMMNMGVVILGLQVIIPKWFIYGRGRALAFSQLGMTLGNIVVPLYIQMTAATAGWRVASMILGIAVVIVAIPVFTIFLRRRPEDMGLFPDGVVYQKHTETLDKTVTSEGGTPLAKSFEVSFSVREVVKMRSFYLLLTASTILMFVAPGMFLHLVSYLTDNGLSPRVSAMVMAVVSGSSAIGSISFGTFADRHNPRLLLASGLALMGIGYLLLIFSHSIVPAFAWAVYMGIVQGGVFTTIQVVWANYYGRESIGGIRGVVWPVQTTAAAIGPLISALTYDMYGGYAFIFALCAFLSVVGSLSVLVAKSPSDYMKIRNTESLISSL
jgi:sugar phosphate permease